ncbi:MAG: hypothetical protein ABEI86_05460 [Halobacteriaceae archaeon]
MKSVPGTTQTFNKRAYFNLDIGERNILNSEEVIIKDNGEAGDIDEYDKIIYPGPGNVSDIRHGISTFGTGDVFIGASDDSIYQAGEFLFIEQGTTSGYTPNEDLLLSYRGTIPKTKTSKATRVRETSFTNIAFLDLNADGLYNTRGENSGSPGTEPIVQFATIQTSFSGSLLDIESKFIRISNNDEEYLSSEGNILDWGLFSDVSELKGPTEQGQIEYLKGGEESLSGSVILDSHFWNIFTVILNLLTRIPTIY